MEQQIYPILLSTLIIMAFVWFYLCLKMFKLLKNNYLAKCKELGSTSSTSNNTPSNIRVFITFLFKRDWKELKDNEVTTLAKKMLWFFAAYIFLFITIFLVMIL